MRVAGLLESHFHAIVDLSDIGSCLNGLLQKLLEIVAGQASRNNYGLANRLDSNQAGSASQVRVFLEPFLNQGYDRIHLHVPVVFSSEPP